MYERMLCREIQPTADAIEETLGAEGWALLEDFDGYMNERYDVVRDLKFPFGNNYGWGYKYSHRSKHLCYVFFERGAFTVTLQLGDREAPVMEAKLGSLLPKTQGYWQHRYPCGEHGGWMHYRVLNREELNDVFQLVEIKKPGAARQKNL